MINSKYSFRLISYKEIKEVSSDFKLEGLYQDGEIKHKRGVGNRGVGRGSGKDVGSIASKNYGNNDNGGCDDGNNEDGGDNVNLKKRDFLKMVGIVGAGAVASTLIPKRADALVFGSTPTSNTVAIKNASNVKINPATEDTLNGIKAKSDLLTFDSGTNPANLKVNVAAGSLGIKNVGGTPINPATEDTLNSLIAGQGVVKLSKSLSANGIVHTPTSGKKIRVYASRFSLNADATSVSFRFTQAGTDHEKYISPKVGGLYGANNHPNYIEGGINEVLYCVIDGTTTVQINIDYLEV
jgi:hypothetical protein